MEMMACNYLQAITSTVSEECKTPRVETSEHNIFKGIFSEPGILDKASATTFSLPLICSMVNLN